MSEGSAHSADLSFSGFAGRPIRIAGVAILWALLGGTLLDPEILRDVTWWFPDRPPTWWGRMMARPGPLVGATAGLLLGAAGAAIGTTARKWRYWVLIQGEIGMLVGGLAAACYWWQDAMHFSGKVQWAAGNGLCLGLVLGVVMAAGADILSQTRWRYRPLPSPW